MSSNSSSATSADDSADQSPGSETLEDRVSSLALDDMGKKVRNCGDCAPAREAEEEEEEDDGGGEERLSGSSEGLEWSGVEMWRRTNSELEAEEPSNTESY